MLACFRQKKDEVTTESGFALIFSLVALLVLTLLGIWALNTSTSEIQVAGGGQQSERQFNVAEGAANLEAVRVGFTQRPFYALSSLTTNRLLIPTTDATFDPGNDTSKTVAGITRNDPTTWPWDNFRDATTAAGQAASANELDYRYLVTYLNSETSPPGYDSSMSAHWYRIQGAAPLVIELGGSKISPTSTMNMN